MVLVVNIKSELYDRQIYLVVLS